jgi:hypothetical protein
MTSCELETWVKIILASAAVISIFIAAYASRQAFKSAKANLDATRARIRLHFLQRYGSVEMMKYLQVLGKWRDDNSDIIARWKERDESDTKAIKLLKDFINERAHKHDNFKELNEARRFVKRYFYDAYELFENGLISRDLCIRICSEYGHELLFNVIEPLDYATMPRYDEHEFKKVRDLLASDQE